MADTRTSIWVSLCPNNVIQLFSDLLESKFVSEKERKV